MNADVWIASANSCKKIGQNTEGCRVDGADGDLAGSFARDRLCDRAAFVDIAKQLNATLVKQNLPG